MKKLSALVLVILLTACISSPATRMPASPTGTPDLQATGTAQVYASWTEMYQTLTAQPPQDTPAPAATETLPTNMPSPAEATPTPIPALQPGQPVTLTNIHMIDAATGWAIEGGGHIVRTRDGGNTWQDVTPPQGIYNAGGFFALDANTAWATSVCKENCSSNIQFVTIWRTTDSGATWANSSLCLIGDCGYTPDVSAEYYIPKSLQFINEKTGWLLVSVNQLMYQDRYRLYKTSDGGANWAYITGSGEGPLAISAIGIVFLNENNGWFGITLAGGPLDPAPQWYTSMSKTTDGGYTWDDFGLEPAFLPTPSASNSYECGTSAVSAIPPKTIDLTFYCDVNEENSRPRFYFHFHSFNSGESWQSWQETGGTDFINATTGWRLSAVDKGKYNLEQTSDGGAHWLQVKTVQWNGALDFVSQMEGWALATSGDATVLVHTKDGGKTWDTIQLPKLNPIPN